MGYLDSCETLPQTFRHDHHERLEQLPLLARNKIDNRVHLKLHSFSILGKARKAFVSGSWFAAIIGSQNPMTLIKLSAKRFISTTNPTILKGDAVHYETQNRR